MKKSAFSKRFRESVAALLTAAFGLVAALAWNGAIRAIFARIFGDADNIVAMLLYAIIVTIVAVIVIMIIARVLTKEE